MGHGICFQLFGGFHHCKHIVFAMVNLWECGVTHLLGCPIFIFQLPSSVPKRLYLLGLINHSTYFTLLDNLCNSVHSQVHPSVLSPSICWWPFLMAWGFMGPLNWKLLCCQSRFTFNPSGSIHLLVVLIFLSGSALWYMGIHGIYFYNYILYPDSNVFPHCSGLDGFASVLPVLLLPLLLPPPEGICHYPWVR